MSDAIGFLSAVDWHALKEALGALVLACTAIVGATRGLLAVAAVAARTTETRADDTWIGKQQRRLDTLVQWLTHAERIVGKVAGAPSLIRPKQ